MDCDRQKTEPSTYLIFLITLQFLRNYDKSPITTSDGFGQGIPVAKIAHLNTGEGGQLSVV